MANTYILRKNQKLDLSDATAFDPDDTWMLNIGASASTAGSGFPLSDSKTSTVGIFSDDNGASVSSGTHMAGIRCRTLLTYTSGNREQEVSSIRGQLVSKQGTNRHNMCAVLGSYEVNTSLTVDGQAATTDTWAQAAVMGRIGAGSAITTINANGVLAGFAAMSATTSFAANSGVYAAFYAGAWSGSMDWGYGLYLQGDKVSKAIQVGELSSSAQTGFHLTSTYNSVIDSFADDNNTTLGDAVYTNIRARTMLFKPCTAGTILGVRGQLKFADEADMGPGVFAGVQGYMELVDDADVKSGGKFWAVDASIDVSLAGGILTVDSGGIVGGLHAELTGSGTATSAGILAGVYVDEQIGTGSWDYGAYLTGAKVGLAAFNTLTPDSTRSNAALMVGGSRAAAGTLTMAASNNYHCDPIQMNYGIAGANPSNTSTVNGFYSLFTHSTAHMANLRLKTCDWTLDVRKNLLDAYCIQGELDIQTNAVVVGGEACAMGLTTSVTSATTGNVWNSILVFSTDQTLTTAANLFLSNRGTGTIPHALYIEANSGTTLTNCIYVNSAGTVTNFVKFSAAAGPVATNTHAIDTHNLSHIITVAVGAATGYIPVFAAVPA